MINNQQILPTPQKFTVTENFGELVIEYPWSRLAGVIVIIFSLFWNGMLIFMLSQIPDEAKFFLIIHGLIGIGMLYYALCSLFNKTIITCDQENLGIKVSPLPAFTKKTIPKSEITQLYFTEKVNRGKNGTTYTYQLHMLDTSNKSRRLLRNTGDPDSARFLEMKLEKFFRIKDAPVAGEYDRK